ncbi:SRPBCC family protein [Nonomuraea angiospora]|uniref:SRPBCC family protein n=1 Tax=Nonomuraea angiospora TaxID=46172 RepID=UPI0029BD5C30|nr:carbon monoxide dehydrogenase subunit G [Nonomuraea angiospora]MDX3100802.1 carbon monoxide dehydrogenase subunit G [Nonomuraea angiospora]
MKVAGSAVIGVQRDQVWAALQDPAVLVSTIPGCERLEETGPDTYRMTVNAGVASIKGVYQGEVSLTDPLAPESFTLKARGQGAPGTVDATVVVRLSEVDDGTRVDYDADAVIGGMIGGVGQRMLGSVARRTAGEFFAAVEDHLRAAVAPAEAGAQAGAVSPVTAPVYDRPPKQHTQTRPWVMLASFGMGAGVALAGVAVGWLFGRASRRT